jgi:flagellar basal-body rod protein FlgG
MPLDALYSAATGMLAQQTSLDNISNNLANVNTAGFKRGRASFADLLYTELTPQQASKQGNQIGLGVKIGSIQTQQEQGNLQSTGQPLDLAIEGEGFFEVTQANGTKGYTRAGSFTTDASGNMVTATGERLSPPVVIPADATDTAIGIDGKVTAKVNGTLKTLGQIRIATFPNQLGLSSLGDNLYGVTADSGAATLKTPGEKGVGALRAGVLEMSNVNAVDEMVGMITTQRSYEAVAKVVTASDEMLQVANQLRR